jgi:hypothetical protein
MFLNAPYSIAFSTRAFRHVSTVIAIVLLVGCDVAPQAKDASPASRTQLAQVQIRLEHPVTGSPSISMLAFRAQATELSAANVLPAVDPLAAQAPTSGCELREVAASARNVRAQGGTVNLQELADIDLEIAPSNILIPSPRVYPPLADAVAGVIAEAGPTDLKILPESLLLRLGGESRVKLTPPQPPILLDRHLQPISGRISIAEDLVLHLSGPSRAFLEIRPFGAPMAIACMPTSSGWIVVPHDLLERLIAGSAGAPISFEAIWRERQIFNVSGESLRVSFETRSQVVLELAP